MIHLYFACFLFLINTFFDYKNLSAPRIDIESVIGKQPTLVAVCKPKEDVEPINENYFLDVLLCPKLISIGIEKKLVETLRKKSEMISVMVDPFCLESDVVITGVFRLNNYIIIIKTCDMETYVEDDLSNNEYLSWRPSRIKDGDEAQNININNLKGLKLASLIKEDKTLCPENILVFHNFLKRILTEQN